MRPRLSEFFGIDLRSLAVFRIGLGAMIVADLVKRSRTLKRAGLIGSTASWRT